MSSEMHKMNFFELIPADLYLCVTVAPNTSEIIEKFIICNFCRGALKSSLLTKTPAAVQSVIRLYKIFGDPFLRKYRQ